MNSPGSDVGHTLYVMYLTLSKYFFDKYVDIEYDSFINILSIYDCFIEYSINYTLTRWADADISPKYAVPTTSL